MKMSDVFALPVKRVGDTLADQGGYADVECAIDAAAHAINCHDGLVDVLQMALALIKANAIENPDCKFSQRLYVHAVDALAKARGNDCGY